MNELKRNGSGYYDDTAYKAMRNYERGVNMDVRKGDVFRYDNGKTVQDVVVMSGSKSCKEKIVNCIKISDKEENNYCVPVYDGMRYANTKVIMFVFRDNLTQYLRSVTDEEMKAIEENIISHLELHVSSTEENERVEKLYNKALSDYEHYMTLYEESEEEKNKLKKATHELEATLESVENEYKEYREDTKSVQKVNDKDFIQVATERDLYKRMYEDMINRVLER